MPQALPLTNYIAQTAASDREYRMVGAQYGNGYDQRTPDGVNSARDTWTIEWQNLNLTNFTTIVTALDTAKGADYFTWTAPGDGASKKFICQRFTKRVMSGSQYSISGSFKQVFDL